MYLADYHVHSRISPDAGCSMAEMAEAAIRAGMNELCFTDHVEPVAWNGRDPIEFYDWDALSQEFQDPCKDPGQQEHLQHRIHSRRRIIGKARPPRRPKDPAQDSRVQKRVMGREPAGERPSHLIGRIRRKDPGISAQERREEAGKKKQPDGRKPVFSPEEPLPPL